MSLLQQLFRNRGVPFEIKSLYIVSFPLQFIRIYNREKENGINYYKGEK